MIVDWGKYSPYFRKEEFICKETGRCDMRPDFMDIMLEIRMIFGKPMVVTSGYRDPKHPMERGKSQPGEHCYGCCADIHVTGADAIDLMLVALSCGIKRVGVNQKGDLKGRFIHLGIGNPVFPSAMWSY